MSTTISLIPTNLLLKKSSILIPLCCSCSSSNSIRIRNLHPISLFHSCSHHHQAMISSSSISLLNMRNKLDYHPLANTTSTTSPMISSTSKNLLSYYDPTSDIPGATPPEFLPPTTPQEPSFPPEMPVIHTPPEIDPTPPEFPPPWTPGPDLPGPDMPGPPIPPSPPGPDIPVPPPDILPPQPPDDIPPRPPGIVPPPSTPPDIIPPPPSIPPPTGPFGSIFA